MSETASIETPPVPATEDAQKGGGQAGAWQPGGLVIVSTPIGNLGDMTKRGGELLAGADLVLCEDTRTTARLLSSLGIRARTEALHEHNEEGRIPGLLARLAKGERIALVSDAGTPLMSDPGYRLVRSAIAAGHAVTASPGPNAAITALTLSGLPPHPFLFLGFAAPRSAARQEGFRQLRAMEAAGLRATIIWHEAPHRLVEMLDDMVVVFGPARKAAVARELTKRFEEVRRGTLLELAESCLADPARGEITVLLGPAEAAGEAEVAANLDRDLTAALASMSVKDAASTVAAASGMSRRVVYRRALELARVRDAE